MHSRGGLESLEMGYRHRNEERSYSATSNDLHPPDTRPTSFSMELSAGLTDFTKNGLAPYSKNRCCAGPVLQGCNPG